VEVDLSPNKPDQPPTKIAYRHHGLSSTKQAKAIYQERSEINSNFSSRRSRRISVAVPVRGLILSAGGFIGGGAHWRVVVHDSIQQKLCGFKDEV